MATPAPPTFAAPERDSLPQGNGIAVAGMILGILGLVLCWVALVGAVLALLGIILGAVGWSKANKIGGKNKGMAIAGVATGIVGLVIGVLLVFVAAAAFKDYMGKSKRTEASLQLNSISRRIKSYYVEKSELPPSSIASLPGPDGSACGAPGNKMPVSREWTADPAWKAIEFQIDEPGRYTYHWTRTSATAGFATAVGDLDCDTQLSTTRLDVTVTDGIVRTTVGEPSPD